MRAIVAFLGLLLVPAAFVLGRLTSPEEHAGRVIRMGDVVEVPQAATRCVASAEGGHPNFFCERDPAGRYEVVFYKDSVLVWKGPEDADSYHWQP